MDQFEVRGNIFLTFIRIFFFFFFAAKFLQRIKLQEFLYIHQFNYLIKYLLHFFDKIIEFYMEKIKKFKNIA